MMRRKANGKETHSVDAYVRSWRKLARPVEKALGVRLVACDPDLAFDTKDGQRFYLPRCVARSIGDIYRAGRSGDLESLAPPPLPCRDP